MEREVNNRSVYNENLKIQPERLLLPKDPIVFLGEKLHK